jgi:hypothetical protein
MKCSRRFLAASAPTNYVLQIDPVVQEAVANRQPVVALESTIVAHGMPFPENLQLVLKIEALLRSKVRVDKYPPRENKHTAIPTSSATSIVLQKFSF